MRVSRVSGGVGALEMFELKSESRFSSSVSDFKLLPVFFSNLLIYLVFVIPLFPSIRTFEHWNLISMGWAGLGHHVGGGWGRKKKRKNIFFSRKEHIEMFVLNRENIFFNCRARGMLQGAKTTKTRWSL